MIETVTKRDGTIVEFDNHKFERVIRWGCDVSDDINKDVLVEVLIKEVTPKLYNTIRTSTLMEVLISTAEKLISLIQPVWEKVAAKLLLLKKYHDRYPEVAFHKGKYPKIENVLRNIGNNLYIDFFSGEYGYTSKECNEINEIIDQRRDLLFKYSGLTYMFSKYTQGNELPQHSFMRCAMFLFMKDKDRIKNIRKFYNHLSQFHFTLATPLLANAGLSKPQLASCVLMKTGDSIEQITSACSDAAIYSKFKGGISVDFSKIRETGAYIQGNAGKSSGPVPFIKLLEQNTTAFSQGGLRKGAAVVGFQWWHPDVFHILAMKRNSTPEELAARHLQYCISIDDYFMNAVERDRDVYLISPTEDERLTETYGKEFEDVYTSLVSSGKYKQKIRARDLWHEIMITRVDTGNLYLFHRDNVNRGNLLKDRFISQTNLCTEIVEPTTPMEPVQDTILDESPVEHKVINAPEISLCTLSSVNIHAYNLLGRVEKQELIDILVRALDNTFELAFYPVKGAEWYAKNYRYLGIGLFNYAYMIASQGYSFKDSLNYCENVISDWSKRIDIASETLAKERGPYKKYKPEHGSVRRNALLKAIAPTASSARIAAATEGIDPILTPLQRITGTGNVPAIVPEFNKYSKHYETAFDIDPEVLLDHAIMRQKYLDQSQSVNMYIRDKGIKSSAKRLFDLHYYAFDNGIKTLYYFQTEKEQHDVCESCT